MVEGKGEMIEAIGGYFELETGTRSQSWPFDGMMALNSGRHALEYILRGLPEKPSCVWLPRYTCEVVLEPLSRLGLEYAFYDINERLEPAELPRLKDKEHIIVNNYFGIKDHSVNEISERLGSRVIVDDAQALFHRPVDGASAFYSPRKFVGVPDGGFAVTAVNVDTPLERDISAERASHLLKRLDTGAQSGFDEFRRNDAALSELPMRGMSRLTCRILDSIDYEWVKARRLANFTHLHSVLKKDNGLEIPSEETFSCPMVYPFLTDNPDLRNRLISEKVFVATYWPNVEKWSDPDSLEAKFASLLIPLPVDQRYGRKEMDRILNIVKR